MTTTTNSSKSIAERQVIDLSGDTDDDENAASQPVRPTLPTQPAILTTNAASQGGADSKVLQSPIKSNAVVSRSRRRYQPGLLIDDVEEIVPVKKKRRRRLDVRTLIQAGASLKSAARPAASLENTTAAAATAAPLVAAPLEASSSSPNINDLIDSIMDCATLATAAVPTFAAPPLAPLDRPQESSPNINDLIDSIMDGASFSTAAAAAAAAAVPSSRYSAALPWLFLENEEEDYNPNDCPWVNDDETDEQNVTPDALVAPLVLKSNTSQQNDLSAAAQSSDAAKLSDSTGNGDGHGCDALLPLPTNPDQHCDAATSQLSGSNSSTGESRQPLNIDQPPPAPHSNRDSLPSPECRNQPSHAWSMGELGRKQSRTDETNDMSSPEAPASHRGSLLVDQPGCEDQQPSNQPGSRDRPESPMSVPLLLDQSALLLQSAPLRVEVPATRPENQPKAAEGQLSDDNESDHDYFSSQEEPRSSPRFSTATSLREQDETESFYTARQAQQSFEQSHDSDTESEGLGDSDCSPASPTTWPLESLHGSSGNNGQTARGARGDVPVPLQNVDLLPAREPLLSMDEDGEDEIVEAEIVVDSVYDDDSTSCADWDDDSVGGPLDAAASSSSSDRRDAGRGLISRKNYESHEIEFAADDGDGLRDTRIGKSDTSVALSNAPPSVCYLKDSTASTWSQEYVHKDELESKMASMEFEHQRKMAGVESELQRMRYELEALKQAREMEAAPLPTSQRPANSAGTAPPKSPSVLPGARNEGRATTSLTASASLSSRSANGVRDINPQLGTLSHARTSGSAMGTARNVHESGNTDTHQLPGSVPHQEEGSSDIQLLIRKMCKANDWAGLRTIINRDAATFAQRSDSAVGLAATVLHKSISGSGNCRERAHLMLRILELSPDAVRQRNSYGSLPLHTVVKRGNGVTQATKTLVVLKLIEMFPEALVDRAGILLRTPVHNLCAGMVYVFCCCVPVTCNN
jgi:hypothetical protein